jgi:hypothetical protein
MNDHYIEVAFAGVFQELAKDRAAGDGVHMRRPAFFAVDSDWFPAPALAQLPKEAFLSVKGMSLHLGWVRNPNIGYGSHRSAPPFLVRLEATVRATSARVFRN